MLTEQWSSFSRPRFRGRLPEISHDSLHGDVSGLAPPPQWPHLRQPGLHQKIPVQEPIKSTAHPTLSTTSSQPHCHFCTNYASMADNTDPPPANDAQPQPPSAEAQPVANSTETEQEAPRGASLGEVRGDRVGDKRKVPGKKQTGRAEHKCVFPPSLGPFWSPQGWDPLALLSYRTNADQMTGVGAPVATMERRSAS